MVEPARQRRRRETAREIVDAAWELCREQGLAGLSLRDLAERVGMRAPSLYAYFDSKMAIYDAMFGEGYAAAIAHMSDDADDDGPLTRAQVKARIRRSVEFATEDPVRYQLMFQRTIPGFEPSAETYALSVAYLDMARDFLARIGIDTPEALDLWTALWSGITNQQISNDPGGDRWSRLVDDAVDMYLDHFHLLPATTRRTS